MRHPGIAGPSIPVIVDSQVSGIDKTALSKIPGIQLPVITFLVPFDDMVGGPELVNITSSLIRMEALVLPPSI